MAAEHAPVGDKRIEITGDHGRARCIDRKSGLAQLNGELRDRAQIMGRGVSFRELTGQQGGRSAPVSGFQGIQRLEEEWLFGLAHSAASAT